MRYLKVWRMVVLFTVMWAAGSLQAQMAHEVLLMVNKNSQNSMRIANFYAAARHIPAHNVVYLDIPEKAYSGKAEVSWEEFSKWIWKPADKIVQERGLQDQVLAWVYSSDFPIRVKTHPKDRHQMSLMGMTFLRNKAIPPGPVIEQGTYRSKLFGGPNKEFMMRLPAISLGTLKNGVGPAVTLPDQIDYLHDGLQDRMPLPSMMLGYTGEKGNTPDEVIAALTRGRVSDYRGQKNFYFVTSEDVRSRCREWQYAPVQELLSSRQLQVTITTNFPAGAENVMGLIMGAETVEPSKIKSFAPGAMAEHLTSWSAEFQRPQTKMTEWIRAGASLSAGSVVEPLSNPDKFPSARFFEYYVGGVTALESYYQSISCPLQILLLGDPLAKPYALPINVKVLGAGKLTGDFSYMAQASCAATDATFEYAFLLDGRLIREFSDETTVKIKLREVADGYHELTAVAKVKHNAGFNGYKVKPFVVARLKRSVELVPVAEKSANGKHAMNVTVGGDEVPKQIRLVCGSRVLDEKKYAAGVELTLVEKELGEGPGRIQAEAVYEDGMQVRSKPIVITVKYSK